MFYQDKTLRDIGYLTDDILGRYKELRRWAENHAYSIYDSVSAIWECASRLELNCHPPENPMFEYHAGGYTLKLVWERGRPAIDIRWEGGNKYLLRVVYHQSSDDSRGNLPCVKIDEGEVPRTDLIYAFGFFLNNGQRAMRDIVRKLNIFLRNERQEDS